MKMHNSTNIDSNSTFRQKKFIIRYQEPQSHSFSSPKKNKIRFSQNNDSFVIRSCIISETDVYRSERQQNPGEDKRIAKPNQVKTQRIPRRSFKTPTIKISSVADLIGSLSPQGSPSSVVEAQNDEKDFQRIPIQYNDERVNGLLGEVMRLKIIYRGYAPKNTYYYLKSLAFNSLHIKPSVKRGNDFQLQFQSKFQSGNLGAVARKSQRQFYIFMREDTNSYGLRQWYYFCVSNKKQGRYKFRIYKFSKFYSLYKDGMKPFIRVHSENNEWAQAGQNIKYQFEAEAKSHFLQFQYEFTSDNMTIQIATQPPYTYGMLREYLKLLLQKYPDIKITKAGQSLAGLDIPKIQIITKAPKNFIKKVIIVMARTHPGETASNWSIEAFIDRIYEIPELKIYYDFYIIPMVNPDGVFLGNHRTGVMGQDINRNFTGQDLESFPEVEAIQKLIQKIKNQKERCIQFLLDLHGHSAKKNIFAFGDEHPAGTHAFLLTHILPKLLNDQISSFKYDYCVFRASKQKKNTARVYLSKKYKINALTFQQSYGLLDTGSIGIKQWRNFGIALANVLKQYYQLICHGSYEGLQNYLFDQIKKEKERQDRRAKKFQLTQNLNTESNIKKDTMNLQKFKTQSGYTNAQFIVRRNKFFIQGEIQQKQDDSVNSQELSSGDEQLENNEQGMQMLRKEIGKLGFQREVLKREIYNIPQRNIEIRNNYQPRLHQQRSSMVPRILKFQMKKRQQINYLKYHEEKTKRKLNITEKYERESIELPNLKKQR